MKKLFMLVALLMLGSTTASAWDCPTVMSSSTVYNCTVPVINDSGAAIASGTVVIWDTGDTEFEETGYPYVTTTTTADSMWTAGVMKTGSCRAGNICDMIVYGYAVTNIADSTDAITADDLVGTTTVAGMAGGYTVAADSCALGMAIDGLNWPGGSALSLDGQHSAIWVDVDCQ